MHFYQIAGYCFTVISLYLIFHTIYSTFYCSVAKTWTFPAMTQPQKSPTSTATFPFTTNIFFPTYQMHSYSKHQTTTKNLSQQLRKSSARHAANMIACLPNKKLKLPKTRLETGVAVILSRLTNKRVSMLLSRRSSGMGSWPLPVLLTKMIQDKIWHLICPGCWPRSHYK